MKHTSLTPEARADIARRQIADAISSLVEATLEMSVASVEWLDQSNSPLGRKEHCRLARAGVFTSAVKKGRRWLVKRADLNSYLAGYKREGGDDDLEAMLRRVAG